MSDGIEIYKNGSAVCHDCGWSTVNYGIIHDCIDYLKGRIEELEKQVTEGVSSVTTIDPTYNREEIDANPIWKLAFVLSEFGNDNAPLGWGQYISSAMAIISCRPEAAELIVNHG